MGTKIEWATDTCNPIIGCSKCSPGCDHCYAERMANRIAGTGNENYRKVITDGKWNGNTVFVEKELKKLSSGKNKIIFVCSMSDMFHESVRYDWLKKIAMAQINIVDAIYYRYYVWLTRRPRKMNDFVNRFYGDLGAQSNVWGMVTVCNQQEADEKIPVLLNTPFMVRGLSIEPMLERINLNLKFTFGIHWVIVGGESGPGARQMKPEWVRSIRDQCKAAGVPFFFKQWGDYKNLLFVNRTNMRLAGWNPSMKKGGRVLDGKIHEEYPI